MKNYKVSVYAICKNEEQNILKWYDSMKEADEIIVLDTGSTDNTIKLIKKNCPKIKLFQDRITPWRFDVARNKSLALVPEDTDICVCTDIDETFNTGWKKSLIENWQNDTTRGSYLYNWSFDSYNKPGTTFYLNKIHKREGYKWKYPVHEILTYEGSEKEIIIPNVVLNHHPLAKESRKDYLPLLEQSLKENKEDDRNAHYLGREYMYYEMWDKAIETLHYHLTLKSATWKDERCASMRFIACSYYHKGYLEEAIMWYQKAIAEASYLREPYTELGYLYYYEKNYLESIKYLKKALKIKEKPKTYINEESAWNETIYDVLSICYYNTHDYKKSLLNVKKALKINPLNTRLQKNYEIIKKAV